MCYSCERADMRGRERRLLGRFGSGVDRGWGWVGEGREGRVFRPLGENHSSVHGIHVCGYPTSSVKVSFNRIQLNTSTPGTEVSILIILTFAYSDMGGRSTGCS